MSVLRIVRMGDPILRRCAAPVADLDDPTIRHLLTDMTDTMQAAKGAGLAAPQVGVSARIIIFHVPESRSSGAADDIPTDLTILLNPDIIPLDEDIMGLQWEGCLSLPGLSGLVPRFRRIRYRGLTPQGQAVDRVAAGFHARVVQHECDHLNGTLYPDRMESLEHLIYLDELHHHLPSATVCGPVNHSPSQPDTRNPDENPNQ